MVEALLGADVGVLQVDQVELGVVPLQAVAVAVAQQELVLRDPVELVRALHRVALEPVEHRLPALQDVLGLVVRVGAVALLDELLGQVQILHLQLDSGQLATVLERDQGLQRRVVGDRAQRGDRAVDAEIAGDVAVLDHGEHQRRTPDLEVGRDLGEVGVAEDHVEAPVFLRVGVGLVAGVDDRPLERGLQADLDLEEVGALGDLEAVLGALLTDPDPSGPGEDLPGDEERGQVLDDVGERGAPAHEVVLVRAVGDALVVGVVLVEMDLRVARQPRGRPGGVEHHLLAGLVPADRVKRVGDLGAGELRVGVVDVEPGAVGEDDVGQPEILVGELAGIGHLSRHVEAARVAQR